MTILTHKHAFTNILRYSSTQKWFLERAQTVTSRSHHGFYIGCILKMAGSHIWVLMQIRWPSLQCAQSCCISLSNGRHTNGRKQIRGYLFKQGRCISRGMHAYGSFCLRNNPLAQVFCWLRQNPRACPRVLQPRKHEGKGIVPIITQHM